MAPGTRVTVCAAEFSAAGFRRRRVRSTGSTPEAPMRTLRDLRPLVSTGRASAIQALPGVVGPTSSTCTEIGTAHPIMNWVMDSWDHAPR